MPSEQAHIALANRNQQAIDYLLAAKDPFPEWVVSIAFYKALHLVEAVLSRDGAHTATHEDRERVLKSTHKYEFIYKHYGVLKRASLIARYLKINGGQELSSFAQYMTIDQVKAQLLALRLKPIEQSVRRMLTDKSAASILSIQV